MTRGDFKNILRRRCANHPALTPEFIRSLIMQSWLELSVKARVFKTYTDITLTGVQAYELTNNAVIITGVEIGDSQAFANEMQDELVPNVDYKITWRDTVNGKMIPHLILLNGYESTTEICRVFINELNMTNIPDMQAANDALTFDTLINPQFELALLDGCVATFKVEYLKSADSAIVAQRYGDTLTETSANIRERIEYP